MADLQAIVRGDQPAMRPFKPMKMRDRVSRPVEAPGDMDDPAFWWKGRQDKHNGPRKLYRQGVRVK